MTENYYPEDQIDVDDLFDVVMVHENVDEEYINIFGQPPTDTQAVEFYQDKLEANNEQW